MKKLALIIAFVFTFAVFANAQSNSQIAVNIPFDFYVQNQKMPAGDYRIESISPQSNQPFLIFRQKDGKATAIILAITAKSNFDDKKSQITLNFSRYDDYYFLSEIRNPLQLTEFSFNPSKTEKFLAKKFGKPTQEMVAVNSAQK